LTAIKTIFLVLVVLTLVAVGGLFYMGQKSREGSAPGLRDGQLTPCPASPNCVSSESGTPQAQWVEPFPADSWSRIPDVVDALGGTVTERASGYLAAEFTSKLFRFTDDVEFRRAGNVVHVRSASRVGHSDMGANRARVDALRERLGSDRR
jgi:uncharacterized protein (DUF1499 family)